MTKGDWITIFTFLSTMLAALSAWWGRRNNKQLQPRPGRRQRLQEAESRVANGRPAKEVSVRDLVLGALDETANLGRRMTRIEEYLKMEE